MPAPAAADDLILFARVVACGSITAAARRTGLPKSTVSRRLSTLEASLGERLLHRGTRTLTVTALGEGVLHHGQRLLEELEAVSGWVEHRQAVPAGRLRVSLPPEFQELSLLPFLGEFVARCPRVQLQLDVSPHRVDLHEGVYDLAVRVAERLPDDASLVARPLVALPHGLYASPDYLARQGHPTHPDELARHTGLPLIASQGDALPWVLTRGPERVQATPCGPVAANSISLQGAMAAAGLGIFGMSERFAAPWVRAGALQRVLPEWQLPTFTAWAVTRGRRLLPPQTRAFIELLQQSLAEPAPDPAPPPP